VFSPIRQVITKGLDKVDQLLMLTTVAYNLVRLSNRRHCANGVHNGR
jgi:hypothetical protein